MSTPSDQSRPADEQAPGAGDPAMPPPARPSSTPDAPANGHRPWGWIAACVVLVLVAGGFAIWAVGLQSDLDDQKDQTAQAQQAAEKANQEAEHANDAVGSLQTQIDDISQGLDDAGDQLQQAGDDARQGVQGAIDELKTKLAALKDQSTQAAADAGGAESSTTPDPAQATPTP